MSAGRRRKAVREFSIYLYWWRVLVQRDSDNGAWSVVFGRTYGRYAWLVTRVVRLRF